MFDTVGPHQRSGRIAIDLDLRHLGVIIFLIAIAIVIDTILSVLAARFEKEQLLHESHIFIVLVGPPPTTRLDIIAAMAVSLAPVANPTNVLIRKTDLTGNNKPIVFGRRMANHHVRLYCMVSVWR